MKKLLFVLTCVSTAFASIAQQQPSFSWVKQTGAAGNQANNNLVLDASGNIYTLGTFSGTVDFDPGSGITNATSVGPNDIYIQKLDAAGNFIWVSTFNATVHSRTSVLTLDASGVYFTASFKGTVDFDPGAGTSTLSSVPNATTANVCIVKLSTSGALTWVKTLNALSPSTYLDPTAIIVDNTGNLYTAGTFLNAFDLDPGAGSVTVTSTGGYGSDAYLLKLNSTGIFSWAKVFGGTSYINVVPTCLKMDGNADLGMAGIYYSMTNANTLPVDFDPGPTTFTVPYVCNGGADAFFSKFTATGSYQWTKVISHGSSQDTYDDFEFDGSGNIYLTGKTTEEDVDFDPGPATYTVPVYYGYTTGNPFIQKLDASGNFGWAKPLRDASSYSYGASIALDAANNVYTTGRIGGNADLNPGADTFMVHAPNNAFNNNSVFNIYVSKLDQNGTFVWGRNLAGAGANLGSAIAVTSQNDIYVAGAFSSTVNFASSPIGSQSLTSAGGLDAYVFKWSQCGTVQTVTGTAVCRYNYQANTYSVTGSYYQYSTGQGGCDSMTVLKVIIQPFTTSALTASAGALVSNDTNAVSYQWYRCSQGSIYAILNNETTASYTPEKFDLYSYAVVVVSSLGCRDTTPCAPAYLVGLNTLTNVLEAHYFPNPVKDKVIIDLSQTQDWIAVEVYNALGRLVEKKTVENSNIVELDLSESAGIYFAKIKTLKGQKTIKLVKE